MAGELENLLAQWATRREIEPPKKDADGKHFFVFDGDFEVGLSQLGTSIFMETDLADLPGRRDEAEALLESLLKLQLAKARGTREVLSLAPDKESLILFRVLRADKVEFQGFNTAIGEFVNAAAFWMSKLEPGSKPTFTAGPVTEQIVFP